MDGSPPDAQSVPGTEPDADAGPGDGGVMGPAELEKASPSKPDVEETPPALADAPNDDAAAASQEVLPHPRRRVSQASNSSDEIILFRGRNRNPQARRPTQAGSRQALEVGGQQGAPCPPPGPVSMARCRQRRGDRRSRRGRARRDGSTSGDSALDDYIANMRDSGGFDEATRQDAQGQRDGNDHDARGEPGGAADIVGGMADGTPVQSRGPADPNTDGQGHGMDESEADEALARLIAGQDLSAEPGTEDSAQSSGDSDWTLGDQTGRHGDLALCWEPPSARRRRGKGSLAQMTLDGRGSELELQMQAAWENNRLKKKQAKKQREELRALGLLGQKVKPDDLRVKYPTGMSMQEVADELRAFLRGTDQSLSFPPMDREARKAIHDLANQFQVKSKSMGKADQRRTTLYKTGRTRPYAEATFERGMARARRRHLPRPDTKGKPRAAGPRAAGPRAVEDYRDGDIVGAAAPELGMGNRGRAILEKMGWSTGTALGAAHNKGILQPVTQTMKRTKAGLG